MFLTAKRGFEKDLSAGAAISQMTEGEARGGPARRKGGVGLKRAEAEGDVRGETIEAAGLYLSSANAV